MSEAHLQTRAHNYGTPKSVDKGKEESNPLPPLQVENIVEEAMTRIPKGLSKKSSYNLNARVSLNYSIMEDLEQIPCAMFALEVLKSFPSHATNSRLIVFYPS